MKRKILDVTFVERELAMECSAELGWKSWTYSKTGKHHRKVYHAGDHGRTKAERKTKNFLDKAHH